MYINNNNYKNSKCHNIYFKALPPKYTKIDNYLIRGPHPSVKDVFKLKKEGVNRIYDFRHKGVRGFKWVERLACKIAGIEYIRKPYSFLHEPFPLLADYDNNAKEVKENGEKGGVSLFHCNSGTHRTALMAAFYAITKGKPLDECKRENKNFKETVNEIINTHIKSSKFFSKNKVISDTKNPIIKMKNLFNNKVTDGLQRAFEYFLKMIEI